MVGGQWFAYSLAIMATSPTVLVDASTTPLPNATSAPVPAKLPIFPLLVAVVTGVMVASLGVGGVVYYLAHTGRLSMQRGTTQKMTVVAATVTHVLVLEPMLVNLADPSGNSYLRIALTLRVADVSEKNVAKENNEKTKDDKGGDEAVAALRDTVLAVLGRQTSDGLLAVDGKAHLKAELKAALAEHNTDLKAMDVFITDFLVQR